VFRYIFPPKKQRALLFRLQHNKTTNKTRRHTRGIKHHVRRRSLHRRFQILRPAYRRPAIRPIFQRHHRSQREWKIQHFGFHLLRVRDYQFESGKTLHIRLTLNYRARRRFVRALGVFNVHTRVHFDAAWRGFGIFVGEIFDIFFVRTPLKSLKIFKTRARRWRRIERLN